MFAIRTPRPDDLPALTRLLDSCSLPTSDLTEEHLGHFIILGQAGRVAGCIGMEVSGQDALLRSLAVDPMMRGEGYGNRLLQLMEDRARDEGVQHLYLLTTSAADFFEHQGYVRTDRASAPESIRSTAQFAGVCPSSATCLYKSLD
ncbi:arsenic resistance N-acetyltransferase ArsN2 [Noviherbaspirillum sp. ST9]|uniref:arsenic resistance N-acetyltransferase ArsN2 n=1 Tax=Noviherbaspirillum sp. ST9 TaxID=3401606 RepID=UPI003B589245